MAQAGDTSPFLRLIRTEASVPQTAKPLLVKSNVCALYCSAKCVTTNTTPRLRHTPSASHIGRKKRWQIFTHRRVEPTLIFHGPRSTGSVSRKAITSRSIHNFCCTFLKLCTRSANYTHTYIKLASLVVSIAQSVPALNQIIKSRYQL
jgi:hypothetical protein